MQNEIVKIFLNCCYL